MKPSKRTVLKNLRELRTLIETSKDPIETRIAYAMEMAVRWTIENTDGWPGLAQEAKSEADIMRQEITN